MRLVKREIHPMKATYNISLRVPADQAALLRRAARRQRKPLATFVRERALASAVDFLHEVGDPMVKPR